MQICVIGADNRQKELANFFENSVNLTGKEEPFEIFYKISISDVIILPLPLSRDGIYINSTDILICDFLKALKEDVYIFAGMCNNLIPLNFKFSDYNENKFFLLENAKFTAESSLSLAISSSKKSLYNCKSIILGSGRISKELMNLLKPFNSNVCVSARKQKDIEFIEQIGFQAKNPLEIKNLNEYDIIYNTVPFSIINNETQNTIKDDSIVIDLCSKKSKLSAKNLIDAKSLPALFCPQSSAEILYKVIIEQLKEEKI